MFVDTHEPKLHILCSSEAGKDQSSRPEGLGGGAVSTRVQGEREREVGPGRGIKVEFRRAD